MNMLPVGVVLGSVCVSGASNMQEHLFAKPSLKDNCIPQSYSILESTLPFTTWFECWVIEA